MIGKVIKFVKDKLKAEFIQYNKENGFKLIREDRGAMEFVAKSPAVWKQAHGSITKKPAAYAGYRSIYWESLEQMSSVSILNHELSHLEDDKKLGFVLSRCMYVVCHLAFGYEKNPFEAKARMAESK